MMIATGASSTTLGHVAGQRHLELSVAKVRTAVEFVVSWIAEGVLIVMKRKASS